jgi:DNA-3-methyladenine glycosylase II
MQTAAVASPGLLDERSLRRAVDALCAADERLRSVVERHGQPPLWGREPGFPTLLLLILEQQVSLASARAAYGRLERRLGSVEPETVLRSSDDELRADGFSRQKTRYARALATAVLDGTLDLEAVTQASDADARSSLTALPGIGAWTADVYLVMALRRPDAWPTGDIALQEAIRRLEGRDARPTPPEADAVAERWRPYRAAAARVLWHLYLSEPARRPARRGLP